MARRPLVDAYGCETIALSAHMTALMALAADDLGYGNRGNLYRDFVAWTLPSGTVCRLCGKAGHDVLPRRPPRLPLPR